MFEWHASDKFHFVDTYHCHRWVLIIISIEVTALFHLFKHKTGKVVSTMVVELGFKSWIELYRIVKTAHQVGNLFLFILENLSYS